MLRRLQALVRRQGPALAAGFIGVAIGFAARSLLASGTRADIAVVAVSGAVGIAVLTDFASESLRTLFKRAARLASGRYPGHRRLEAERYGQTRISDFVPGAGFERERWVDLSSLDNRGYVYGVAQSPTYIPLYGNGLARIEQIDVVCASDTAPLGQQAQELIDREVQELVSENRLHNRPFQDTPLFRLTSWSPPVDNAGPLALQGERVGQRRYAAVVRMLKEDHTGALRRRFAIEPRVLANPLVCGCLGVEIAVVTSDERLVLAHRGELSTDYRGLLLTTIGRGLGPLSDVDPQHPGRLDPRLTVERGAREELGIAVAGERTRFLALGLETSRMDPDLLGYIEVEQSYRDVEAAYMAARAKDRWESVTLSSIEFSPEAVADLLASTRALTPATPMNLVFAVSDRFGERECERAMTRRR